MRAVVITKNGGPEVLKVQERPDPEVKPGEIRVATKAAGINFADLMARSGVYPDAPKPPSVVGYEVAGEVESVGDGVDGLRRRRPRRGRHALRRLRRARERPSRGPSPPASRLALVRAGRRDPRELLDRLRGLRDDGRPAQRRPGAIHAAAGGVGIAATQIAKDIGAEIFGTASASKHDAIRAQGVDHPDRLPHDRLRRGGHADHERRRRGRRHGRDRPVQLSSARTRSSARAADSSCSASPRSRPARSATCRPCSKASRGCRWPRCRGGRAFR